MRDIKFRIYDKKKKMFTNYKIYDDMLYGMDKNTGVWIRIKDNSRFELMQYTGLKDKNGKEIYEGDIVELKSNNGCCEMTGIIIYDEYDLAFELKDIEEGTQECLWYAEQELEVIGNIYENEDLLEKASD